MHDAHIVGVAVWVLIAFLFCPKGSLTHQDRTVSFSYGLLRLIVGLLLIQTRKRQRRLSTWSGTIASFP
jgi:hypothetical protein